MSDSAPTIRRELRPGDFGEIIAHHGRLYAEEFGVDGRFEGHVARSVSRAADLGFPREREALWIVERDGRHAGSVAISDEGDGLAMLRWVTLDRELRGTGLGRRMIAEAVDHARENGFETVALETFSELQAAAAIYRSLGFELAWQETKSRWGRPSITYQRYELAIVPADAAGHLPIRAR